MVTWERRTLTSVASTPTMGVLVLVASCSSPETDSGETEPSATESASAAATATTIPTLPAGSPVTTPLARLDEGQFALVGGGGPDWMGEGFGSLWVRRDNAILNRLAPNGNVDATIDAGIWQQPVCQGLGVTELAVWGCATSGKLMRVDPRTNKIVDIVPIKKVNEQGRLPAYDGKIWVLTGDGDQLVPVSEQDSAAGDPIALDAFCTDVADQVIGSMLWVACPYDGAALQVDLMAGEVTARVEGLSSPTAVTADDENAFVCTEDGVVQISAEEPAAVGIQPFPGGVACTVRITDGTVWVRPGNPTSDFLVGLDSSTGEVTQRVTAPGDVNGGDVIAYDGSLWVSSYEAGKVFKLAPPGP